MPVRDETNEALAAFGLALEDEGADANPDFEVWPENWDMVRVFLAMETQWQIGFGGKTGLRYEAFPVVCDMLSFTRKERLELFNGLQIMEKAALRSPAEETP